MGASDAGFTLEQRRREHQPQASQQAADGCTEDAGIQTVVPERPTRRHRASQCPDASDPRFCRLDAGTATDIRAVVDSFTAMDMEAREEPQTALSPRAPAALSEQLVQGEDADSTDVKHQAAEVSSPAPVPESEAGGAAKRTLLASRKVSAQPVTATDIGVQTEEAVVPSKSGFSTEAALAVVVRQLITRTGPAQPVHLRTCSMAAQTDTAEAAGTADGHGAAQRACGSAVMSAQPMRTGAAADTGYPADCLQISSPPAVQAAAQDLTLSDMAAATEQHPRPHQEPADGAPTSASSGVSPDGPSAAAETSPVPSTTASITVGQPESSIPGTPRRNIHRRLWRSGRTSEWADLFPCTGENDCDSRAQSCSDASTARDSQNSPVDSSCSGSTDTTTSRESVSSCSSSHSDASASPVPLLRTAACQTSDAAVSASTTDDSDLCILWDALERHAPRQPSLVPLELHGLCQLARGVHLLR